MLLPRLEQLPLLKLRRILQRRSRISYISLADANTYNTSYGNTAWTGTDAAKEIALRQAGRHLNIAYKWHGARVSAAQTMAWPRIGMSDCDGNVILSTTVPTAVINAQCELAVRALSATLATDVTASARVKRQKVDVIEVEYESGRAQQTTYTIVNDFLKCFVSSGSVIELSLG